MTIQTITNANVYLADTLDLMGKAEKVTLPDIEPTFEQMSGMGLVSEFEVPTGLKKMMLKLAWKSFYPDAMKHRFNFLQTTRIQIRGSLESYDSTGRSEEETATVLATVQFSKTMLGALERAKPITGMEDEMQVHRLELSTSGVQRLKFDLFANIYEVEGNDMFANFRSNLGRQG